VARILWRTSSWPLITSGFAARPISDWVLAILYPVEWLAIPKNEARRFQIFAALTLDLIWFSRNNKLIHEALQPVPAKVLKQAALFLLGENSIQTDVCSYYIHMIVTLQGIFHDSWDCIEYTITLYVMINIFPCKCECHSLHRVSFCNVFRKGVQQVLCCRVVTCRLAFLYFF
jgi:hypothetical protein